MKRVKVRKVRSGSTTDSADLFQSISRWVLTTDRLVSNDGLAGETCLWRRLIASMKEHPVVGEWQYIVQSEAPARLTRVITEAR